MKYLDTNEGYCLHNGFKMMFFKESSSLLGFKKLKKKGWSFDVGEMSLWLNFVVVIDLAKQKEIPLLLVVLGRQR